MKLLDYRILKNLSRRQAAQELKTSQMSIWRWETGRFMPSAEMMASIQSWSKDAVTPNDHAAAVNERNAAGGARP